MLSPPPLSLALQDITAPGRDGAVDVRALLTFAARAGFRSVQLNAALPGIRPRDLDRSARRDLAALLRRSQLACSGLDLFIPSAHFADPAHADRAAAAAADAVELAADLARLASSGVVSPGSSGGAAGNGRVLSLTLPKDVAASIRDTLAERAEVCSVRIADHTWPPAPPAGPIGIGVDPGALLMAGDDPPASVSRIGAGTLPGAPGPGPRDALVSARLSNASAAGRVRVQDPAGRLDLLGYIVALAGAGYRREVVLDLRGTPDPGAGAPGAAAAWYGAAPSLG